ncbi:hypothetical protein GCM10012289_70980 [Nonomuraea cavernae]|uniref:Uncharacterized protein n=1 Tax=Nonomuraea cavernae TaxID=2045107 RepID=A0A917ZEP8_9ACTN|nr:hypothetical protein GCM10012289_70980 [Nonomuraea cavernae]
MAVVTDPNRLHTVQLVDLEVDADEARFRVQGVPDHLRDRAYRVPLLRKSQQMVGFSLDVNGWHTATIPDDVRNRAKDDRFAGGSRCCDGLRHHRERPGWE